MSLVHEYVKLAQRKAEVDKEMIFKVVAEDGDEPEKVAWVDEEDGGLFLEAFALDESDAIKLINWLVKIYGVRL